MAIKSYDAGEYEPINTKYSKIPQELVISHDTGKWNEWKCKKWNERCEKVLHFPSVRQSLVKFLWKKCGNFLHETTNLYDIIVYVGIDGLLNVWNNQL